VLTPHLGASTAEAQALVAVEAAQQVLDVLAGRPARYAVNAPLVAPESAATLGPYLDLTRLLGRFYAQFTRAGVATLELQLSGEAAEHDPAPLTAAALEGLLGASTEERVNLINAPLLAKARGIQLSDRRVHASDSRAEVLLQGGTGLWETTVGGSVVGGEPRLTRLGGYAMDMAPAPFMLVTRHQDRPGTMGRIGLMLGEADVNISAMSLGRSGPREDALMVLALDDSVPGDVAARIRSEPAVLDLWTIELPIASGR
jgi:D-3-phosphoglycerate dehydrogenase